MANGLFNLKQVMQGIQQGGWPNQVGGSTFGARFAGSGSGQYLTGPTTGVLNFSTGAFTVEFWAFINAYGGGSLTIMFSASNASADFQIGVSDTNGVYWHNSGTQLTSPNTSKPLGKWVHIALVRSGTTASLFCNGVRSSTTTNSAAVNLTNFNIGSYQAAPSAYMVQGWLSNLRITNTAVYDPTATTLTLPLSSLTAISGTQLLTLQNATVIDNSANALTITNNGSVGMQSVAPFGLANYAPPTVEYVVVGGGGSNGNVGGGAGGFLSGVDPVPNSQTLLVTVGGGGSGGTNGSASVFGQISAAGGGYGAGNSGQPAGAGASGGGGFNGNFPGQGIVGQGNPGGLSVSTTAGGGGGGAGAVGEKGVQSANLGGNGGNGVGTTIGGALAVYAGGGSGYGSTASGLGGVGGGGAPGANGTANTGGGGGANTVGGTSGGSGIVIVAYPDVYAPASATTGAPTVSTSGSGSIAFNGSSAYIRYAGQSAFAFGTGDFTIEGWFYVTSLASGIIAWDFRTAGTNGAYGLLELSANGQVQYYANSAYQISSSAGLNTVNTWAHIVIARSGTVTKLFFNGTQAGSGYTDTTNYLVGVSSPYIGSGSSPSAYLPGYISNFRVVKGTAVYTSNFTPPTAPLTAISGTSLLLNSNSGAFLADNSTNSFTQAATAGTPAWNAASPFTGTGYKNRVYTWTASGSITF